MLVLLAGKDDTFGLLSLLNNVPLTNDDLLTILLIIFVLILINFIWELLNEILESCLYKKQRHILVMIQKLFQELAIVGLWSVGLFVISSFDAIPYELKHIFEIVHISLFILVIIFIVVCASMALLSWAIFWFWHFLEKADPG
eukprot:TRINITY_DN2327_c0_g1_i1.p1 TRINITY_DN2327_c0_g1~~TRINITY_DN2327_c0_g1_i1.p1  ORF type:complete len:143 (-),score=5.75 TRINITY_DN2327_c0_g1_i1:39-467(-)